MPARPHFVFDLDGTLSDRALGIGRSLDHALTAHGFAPVPPAMLSRFIGAAAADRLLESPAQLA